MTETHTEHDEVLELIPSYALGALDAADLERVEAHLADGCPACEMELATCNADLERLASSTPPEIPSERSRRRLLDRIAPARTGGAGTATAWLARAAALAGLALLVWSAWSHLQLQREVTELAASGTETVRQLAQTRHELATTRLELMQMRRAHRIVAAPERSSVVLAGLDPAPGAYARTIIDPVGRRAVFYAANLPAIERDRTYQLWWIAGGTPVSAGVFDVDADGNAMLLVETAADPAAIQTWAVTVEPAGGVPQPTGPMVLKG